MLGKIAFGVLLCSALASCKDDNNPDSGPFNYSYVLVNASTVDVGIKVTANTNADSELSRADTFRLKPGAKMELMHARKQISLSDGVRTISVMDQKYKVLYKDMDLTRQIIDGDTCRIFLELPPPAVKDIQNYVGGFVQFTIDDKSIGGFYEQNGGKVTYFKTSDDFVTIERNPVTTNDLSSYGFVRKNGNTIIAADMWTYASPTVFVVSKDDGKTWSNLLTIANKSTEDFLAVDFTSDTEGKIFKYRDFKYTDVYKVEGATTTKLSTITGYCVRQCTFTDALTGYVLANKSNNVSPADTDGTYFMKTTDGGTTWTTPALINDGSSGLLLAFQSGRLLAKIVTQTGQSSYTNSLYASDDGGTSWSKVTLPTGLLNDIEILSGTTAFAKMTTQTGPFIGPIYKSTDEGKTWTPISQPVIGIGIHFFNEQIGYSQYSSSDGQYLYVTRDGGNTWKEEMYPYAYLKK